MKEVTELMLGSFESTELSAAVKVGAISSFSVLASDVESYGPNCLPPSVMSLNKLASLFTVHSDPCLPIGPHKFLQSSTLGLLVSLYTSQKSKSTVSM